MAKLPCINVLKLSGAPVSETWGKLATLLKQPIGMALLALMAVLAGAGIVLVATGQLRFGAVEISTEPPDTQEAQPITKAQMRSIFKQELGGVETRLASLEAGMKALAGFQSTEVRLAMLEAMQAAQDEARKARAFRDAKEIQP